MPTATVTADGSAGEAALPTRIAQRDVQYPTANLGTLNPTFKPPSSCADLTLAYIGHYMGAYAIVSFNYGYACDPQSTHRLDPSCYPTRFAAAYDNMNEAVRPVDIVYPVFSPASSCPDGYVSACGFAGPASSTTEAASGGDAERTSTALGKAAPNAFGSIMGQLLAPTQTAVGCCPSAYECYSSLAYHCISKASPGSAITADGNSVCTSHTTNIREFTGGPSDSIYADAPCIVLVQDQPRTESATATPSSSTSVTSQTTTSAVASSSSSPSSTISTGAKAAIGVCVPLFAIFAALAIFAFLRRRRSRSHGSADPDNATAIAEAPANNDDNKAEMAGSDPRASTILGSPSERVVSVLSDRSVTPSQGGSENRTSELYGSTPLPRLHEDIMELPAETTKPVTRKPVPENR